MNFGVQVERQIIGQPIIATSERGRGGRSGRRGGRRTGPRGGRKFVNMH